MYCIECGAPIEATARICGTCRFPQPLEEFADVEPVHAPGAGGAQKPVFPVRLEEPPRTREKRPRLAAAIAVFVALCISTGLSMYLLTRPHAPPSSTSPQPETAAPPTPPPAETQPPDKASGEAATAAQDGPTSERKD